MLQRGKKFRPRRRKKPPASLPARRSERALTFEKSRSKRYEACSDVEGVIKITLFQGQKKTAAQRRTQTGAQR